MPSPFGDTRVQGRSSKTSPFGDTRVQENQPTYIDRVGRSLVQGYNEQMDAANQGYDPGGMDNAISEGRLKPAFGDDVDTMSQQVIAEQNPDTYLFYDGKAYLREQAESNDATDTRATRMGRILLNSEPIAPVANVPKLMPKGIGTKIKNVFGDTRVDEATEVAEEVGGQAVVAERNAAREAPESMQSEIPDGVKGTVDDPEVKAQGQKVIDELSPEDQQAALDLSKQKKIVGAAAEILNKHGITRNPDIKASEQLYQFLRDPENYKNDEAIGEIMARNEVGPEDLAAIFAKDASDAGKRLQSYSAFNEVLNDLTRNMSEAEARAFILEQRAARGTHIDEGTWAWFKNANNTRLGLMVSQLPTAMRDFTTAGANLTIHTFEKGVDNAIRAARGEKPVNRELVTDTLSYWIQLFGKRGRKENWSNPHKIDNIGRKPKNWSSMTTDQKAEWVYKQNNSMGLVEKVLAGHQTLWDRMFTRYSADAVINTDETNKAWRAVDKAVQWLNTASMFQEYAMRRTVFRAELDELLRRNTGEGLERWAAQNKLSQIDPDYIQKAVEKSLDATWANDPKSHFGKEFVKLFSNPIGSMILPFPRFMSQALKWQFDRAPGLGMLKLASKRERDLIRSGDYSALAQQTTGTAMLYAAWELRNSGWAGEHWYEVQDPFGEGTIDVRAYAPFSAYLWVADTMKRARDGTLDKFHIKNGLEAIGGLQHSQALDIVNDVVRYFESDSSELKGENLVRGIADFTGNYVSTYAIPFTQLRDALSAYDKRHAEIRDPALGDYWDTFIEPLQRRLPVGVSEDLPLAFQPTSSEPVVKKDPITRMLTGVTTRRDKNPAEEELIKHGFDRMEILPPTGDPVLDYLEALYMGPEVENWIVPFVQSETYRNASQAEQGAMLRDRLGVAREQARFKAYPHAAERYMRKSISRIPSRDLKMYNEWFNMDLRELPMQQ